NPIVIGLVMASLTAAAMSTLDSTYNSMATVATFDIYKRFICRNASNSHYEKIARKLSFISALIVIAPAIFAISNESILKTTASLTSIFVGIRLGSFALGFFSKTANETGVIFGSIASTIAVCITLFTDISWPWYAPIGTLVFLFFGATVSRYKGSLSPEQYTFINNQRNLFAKPTIYHYGLLIFAFISITACFLLPKLLRSLLF
ncbi:MAG: sodium:solute symporter family transporter, partial [Plesiomonas sp.]